MIPIGGKPITRILPFLALSRRGQGVELRITNVDQKYQHGQLQSPPTL